MTQKIININKIEYTITQPCWDDYMELFQNEKFTKEMEKDEDLIELSKEKTKIMLNKWVQPEISDEMYKSTNPEIIALILTLSQEFAEPIAKMVEIKKKLGSPLG